jgi:cytoskeletal protein CcmA (bactofilin family)
MENVRVKMGDGFVAKDPAEERVLSHSLAFFGEDAAMNGLLRSDASIRMSGSFKGVIIADQELVIAPDGRVEAKVKARKAVISGLFQGEMIVLDEIEITPTGRFLGTLIQKESVLKISPGGRFDGRSIFVDDLDTAFARWELPAPRFAAKRDADKHIALHELKL